MKNKYCAFLVSMSFLIASNISAQVDLKDGLMAYYPFIGNANDVSGNDLDGKAYGMGFAKDRFGNSNAAADFDGDYSYIKVPYDNKLNLTGDKSVSLWFYLPSEKINKNAVLLHMKNASQLYYPNYIFQLCDDPSYGARQHTASFFFGNDNSNYSANTKELYPNYLKQWIHLTASYSKTTGDIKVYFNGKLSDSAHVGNISSNSSDADLQIGRQDPDKTTYFTGMMDEIRIYNRAINESEVLALYNETDGNASVENLTNKKIELYPNPATNSFSVNVTQTSEVFIYDIKGALLNTKTISPNDNNIDISTYSNGVYMVKLIQGNEIGFAKLVK